MSAPSRLYASAADRAYASPLHWSHEPDSYRPPHDGLSVGDRRYLVDVAELTEAVEIGGHGGTIATASDSRHVNRTSQDFTSLYDSEATS